MRRLKDSPLSHGEWLAAFAAIVKAATGSFAFHLFDALRVNIAAMRADWAVRPKRCFDERKSGVFVLEAVCGEN